MAAAYPAYDRGRYVEARKYLIVAQRVFEQLGDSNLGLQANLLNDRAFTDSVLGDPRSVFANHIQALEIQRELFS